MTSNIVGTRTGCGGEGECSPTEGICSCLGAYAPQGSKAGEAGTCETAMSAVNSAIGGMIQLFMLLCCFLPCLCFPWVYRAEQKLRVDVFDPYLDSYQAMYHTRVTLVEAEGRQSQVKEKTFKEKVWEVVTCQVRLTASERFVVRRNRPVAPPTPTPTPTPTLSLPGLL